MKQLIKELSLSGLTLKQKAIVWYFVMPSCKHGGSPVLVLVFRGCQLR